jgi:hypothetical protein
MTLKNCLIEKEVEVIAACFKTATNTEQECQPLNRQHSAALLPRYWIPRSRTDSLKPSLFSPKKNA